MCLNLFGMEEVTKHDPIKKVGKIQMTPGVPEGGYLPNGAGAAGVHLGGGPPIRSSSGGQDGAIDTRTIVLGHRGG